MIKKFKKNELKNIVENCIKQLSEGLSSWYDDNHHNYDKEDEIDASWEGYKNTFGDENGNIPTKLHDKDSEEATAYRHGVEDFEDVWDLDDYPNAFTDDDEGYASMQAQDKEHPLHAQCHKQVWNGKVDNNGNPVYGVDFSNMIENKIGNDIQVVPNVISKKNREL